jgi:hypothetical protein
LTSAIKYSDTNVHYLLSFYLYVRTIAIERSRNSLVGIATDHGLDGRGSNSDRGNVLLFSTASRSSLGLMQRPMQLIPAAISPGVKWPGHEADYSPPCLQVIVLN